MKVRALATRNSQNKKRNHVTRKLQWIVGSPLLSSVRGHDLGGWERKEKMNKRSFIKILIGLKLNIKFIENPQKYLLNTNY